MKKTLMIGTMALIATLSASSVFAAGAAKGKETKGEVHLEAFGPKGSPRGMTEQQLNVALTKLSNRAQLDENKALAISMSIKSDAALRDTRASTFAELIEMKEAASKNGDKIKEALADAAITFLSNASLHTSPSTKKMESILMKIKDFPTDAIVKYTAVLKRHAELIESGTVGSSDEATLKAIMDTQKVDRTEAMKIKERLEKCLAA